MKTKIIVDSTIDIAAQWKSRVSVVPITVRFGEEEYLDGVTIDHQTFYEKLIECDRLPATSQATPEMFLTEFQKIRENHESAVVITISSKFSGTYQSAAIAAAKFENIYVVDSGNAAIGSGVLAERALQLAEEGMGAHEIAERLGAEKEKIVLIALLDTLEYLKKGGRISKTVALAGAVLNIKPVISVTDGEIAILGKARGSKMGNNLLVQEIEKTGGVNFQMPVLLGFTGLSDALLLKYMEDSKQLWKPGLEEIPYTTIGSSIGTHVGPGAIGAAFFKK